jgi:hypothetical protein
MDLEAALSKYIVQLQADGRSPHTIGQYAASGGEVSCLDCATGKVLWHNTMKGFGTGFVALAGGASPATVAELERIASTSAAIAAASG